MTLPQVTESTGLFIQEQATQYHFFSSSSKKNDFFVTSDGKFMSSRDYSEVVNGLHNGEVVDIPLSSSSSDDDGCLCCCNSITPPDQIKTCPLLLFPCLFILLFSGLLFIGTSSTI